MKKRDDVVLRYEHLPLLPAEAATRYTHSFYALLVMSALLTLCGCTLLCFPRLPLCAVRNVRFISLFGLTPKRGVVVGWLQLPHLKPNHARTMHVRDT